MYGKIFSKIYTGTLYGHWEAIVTFQQMIVLADADGIVDMTPQAICAATSIPIEIIEKGIKKLSEPDEYSRTPGEDGRRIVCIDEHRPWGWQIVNHAKYKNLRDASEVREQNRIRAKRFRDKRNAASRGVTHDNAESRHTYTDTDTKNKNASPPDGGPVWSECLEILKSQNIADRQARSFLGLMCRDYAEADVVEAVKASVGKANIPAYVRGVLKSATKRGASAVKVDAGVGA